MRVPIPQKKGKAVAVTAVITAIFLTGLFCMIYGYNIPEKWDKIEATVVDYYRDPESSVSLDEWTKYRYEYKGEIYTCQKNGYSNAIFEGDTVEMYCNPENPQQIVKDDSWPPIVMGGLIVAFIFGAVTLIEWINLLGIISESRKKNKAIS